MLQNYGGRRLRAVVVGLGVVALVNGQAAPMGSMVQFLPAAGPTARVAEGWDAQKTVFAPPQRGLPNRREGAGCR